MVCLLRVGGDTMDKQEIDRCVAAITAVVSEWYDIPAQKLFGKCYARSEEEVSTAKHVALYMARLFLKLSYARVDALFSVGKGLAYYSYLRVAARLRRRPWWAEALTEIEDAIQERLSA